MLTLRSVEALDDYWLRLTLSDGTTIERNVRELLRGPIFEGLRADYSEFRLARVLHGTVAWGHDLDLDPCLLIWDGPAPREIVEPPAARLVLHHPSAQPTL
jgi:hypothetical protein